MIGTYSVFLAFPMGYFLIANCDFDFLQNLRNKTVRRMLFTFFKHSRNMRNRTWNEHQKLTNGLLYRKCALWFDLENDSKNRQHKLSKQDPYDLYSYDSFICDLYQKKCWRADFQYIIRMKILLLSETWSFSVNLSVPFVFREMAEKITYNRDLRLAK